MGKKEDKLNLFFKKMEFLEWKIQYLKFKIYCMSLKADQMLQKKRSVNLKAEQQIDYKWKHTEDTDLY